MRRAFLGSLSVTALVGGSLALAAPAQAIPAPAIQVTPNMVWTQQYERPSADATCDDPPASLDIPWQADWDPNAKAFHPSYAEWPNDGKGGWVCTRSFQWADGTWEQIVV